MLAQTTSAARQRVRSGCYTCKVRKVKCKQRVLDSEDLDRPSTCDCCKRLGLECRWSAPRAGEDYNPPPKRRQTIGQRRGHSRHSSRPNQNTDSAQPSVRSENNESEETPTTTHFNTSRPSGQFVSNPAPPTSLGLDVYVDMLGDLPFNTDFAWDLDPVDLHFNGEGFGFSPLPLDHPLPLPTRGSGDSANPPGPTDPLSSHFLSFQNNSLYDFETRPGTGLSGEISNFGANEQHLIQHYLGTMTGYAKLDDYPRRANNLYTTAFSKSLSFKPLLYAILAFSASHLALENDSYVEQASEYERLAHESFEACKHHASEPDSLLSALFVRAKRVHLLAGDIESFHTLVTEATRIVVSERGQLALKDPFSLVQRIVIRLALLDARASCYRLGGGKLIKALRNIPAMSFVFDLNTSDNSTPNALVSLLRADILRTKVAGLDLRLRSQMESENLISSPVRTEDVRSLHEQIEHEIQQWEQQMSSRGHDPDDPNPTEGILEASTYAQYLVMAALHSAILYLCLLYPSTSAQRERSVSRILYCQLKL